MKSAKINTIEDLKSFIENFFSKRSKKVRVILFGSRARGTHTEHSDIDIAVDSEEDIEEDILELKDILEESELPQKVDIILLPKASEDLREEILREGKVWIDLRK